MFIKISDESGRTDLTQNRYIFIRGKTTLTLVICMEVAITKMSSKGQVVIPAEMRADIPEGEKLLIIHSNEQLIMKKASDLDKNMAEEIEFAKRTDEAWKRIEKGKGITMDFDDFLEEMKKW